MRGVIRGYGPIVPGAVLILVSLVLTVWAGAAQTSEQARRPFLRVSLWKGEPSPVSPVVTQGLLADGVSTKRRIEALQRLVLETGKGWSADDPETLRVIAIRVEFEQSEGMTQGRFRLEPFDDPNLPEAIIDPPPHGRSYFMKHLEALDYYYRAQSYGRLALAYDVFPQAEDSAFVLPDISVYNPDATQWSWTVEGLTQLYHDAIVLADTSDASVFRGADSLSVYIVFHAGPDLQTDVAFDSPNDIPSFTIGLGDSDRFYVRRPDSLMVYDGMVIPETVSQDGLVGAINGVLAHEFGHILGALDLYNTCDWSTGIGFWGLMGSGNQVALDLGLGVPVEGILPPSLCAWTKWWIGFLDFETITSPGTYVLSASGLQDGSANAYRIPVNGDEYFLLENRQRDLEPDRVDGIFQDRETGVAMGMVDSLRLLECRGLDPDAGCFPEAWNYHYDFGLPGSGVLIWHIDDERIWETMAAASNAVNCDYWRRGVDLEEADQLEDIGNPYSWYNQGSELDPFFAGNNDTFNATSVPNSNSNFGAITHIAVTDIDSLSNEMRFTVRLGAGVPGWPVAFTDTLRTETGAPAAVDLDGDGTQEIVQTVGADVCAFHLDGPAVVDGWPVVTGDSLLLTVAAADLDGDGLGDVVVGSGSVRMYAWRGDGSPFFATSKTPAQPDSPGVFWRCPGHAVGAVALADIDGGGSRALIGAVGESLMVWGWEDGTFALRREWVRSMGDTLRALAVREHGAGGPAVLALLEDSGDVRVVDGSGADLPGWPVSLPVESGEGYLALADFDRASDAREEVLVDTLEGLVTMLSLDGQALPGWPVLLSEGLASAPAVGDLDGDGFLDVALGTADGRVEVLSYSGTPLIGWRVDGVEMPSAVFADVTGDSVVELISSFRGHQLTAWDAGADPVWGWPLATGARASLAPLVADLRGDGNPEVVVPGNDGWLYAYEVSWASDCGPVSWGAYLGNSARTACFPPGRMPAEPPARNLALVDQDLVVYPNPCRGGTAHIQYRLGFSTSVKVTILDLTGQEVWEHETLSPEGPNEIEWPTDLVASGLYLCRMEVEERSGTTVVFRKVAVVN